MQFSTVSIKWSLLCIGFLFLCMASLGSFESNAISKLLSFWLLWLLGLPSIHLSIFLVQLFVCLLLIFLILVPLAPKNSMVLFYLYFVWCEFFFEFWFCHMNFDRPRRVQRCGYFLNIHLLCFVLLMCLILGQLSWQLVWMLLGEFLIDEGYFCPLYFVGGCSLIECCSFGQSMIPIWGLCAEHLLFVCPDC